VGSGRGLAPAHGNSRAEDASYSEPASLGVRHSGLQAELKRLVNLDIVDTLRDLADPGLPAPRPSICLFRHVQFLGT
jgi:hypothetical protein